MSSRIVSSAEPTLHFCSKLNNSSIKPPTPDKISTISFSSQVTKSRVPIRTLSGSRRARDPTRISAFYASRADTAETLYQVLGIAETGSTVSDIKKAYKQMARKYHPDVSPPERVDEYTRRFIMVNEAYKTLSNPQSRGLYDRDLAGRLGYTGKSHQYHQEMAEKGQWKTRWESQLDGMKRRGGNSDSMSWGVRMRNQT